MGYILPSRLFWCALAALVAAIAFVMWHYRPDLAIKVGTASISHTLCDEIFVSGLDADRVFDEEVRPQRGLRILLKRLRYAVDPQRQQVETTWAVHFASVAAHHKVYGCSLGVANSVALGVAPDLPNAASSNNPAMPIAPVDTKLSEALDRAFAEPPQPPYPRAVREQRTCADDPRSRRDRHRSEAAR